MSKEIKLRIIKAGHKAVDELIRVAEESILKHGEDGDDLAADKLKNAAATKKLAIFDAFEILSRIESERENIEAIDKGLNKNESKQGFAERRSK
jgi:hypothetical protein